MLYRLASLLKIIVRDGSNGAVQIRLLQHPGGRPLAVPPLFPLCIDLNEHGGRIESVIPEVNEIDCSRIATAIEGHSDVMQAVARSDEQTYELQSLMRTSYAVFCL